MFSLAEASEFGYTDSFALEMKTFAEVKLPPQGNNSNRWQTGS